MPGFDDFNTTPPTVQETTETSGDNTEVINEQATEPTPEPAKETTQTGQDTGQPPVEEPKVDEFIETFNKRFNTQFKADDDIKPLFDLPKKVSQYEEDLKAKADLEKSVNQYKQDLDNLKRTEGTKYLSTPLMRKAYVADQLLAKYPDKDPNILTELAMADTSKMSDIDVLAKERKVNYPNRKLEDIKIAILSELGIDPTAPPEEWDTVARTRLEMRADDARANIKNLTSGIEFPKVETPEEAQQRMDADLAKRAEAAKPLKEEYSKFDKFKMGDGLEYTVPKEFQEKLGDMFDAFVLQAGNEPTKENLQTLSELRDALFFNSYKKEIYETMYKDAETKIRAELDKKLANTEPPNSATASDGAINERGDLPGTTQFLQDFQGKRVTRL